MPANQHVRFQRGNFVVRSIDKALLFYRDVLGLELVFMKDSPSDSYSYDVFEIDKAHKLRFAVLSAPDQPRVLALTEVPTDLTDMPMPRRSAIVVEVGDVDAVIAGATAAGCKVYAEDELLTHDGRRGREVGIVDFDGNLTVIYNIPQAET